MADSGSPKNQRLITAGLAGHHLDRNSVLSNIQLTQGGENLFFAPSNALEKLPCPLDGARSLPPLNETLEGIHVLLLWVAHPQDPDILCLEKNLEGAKAILPSYHRKPPFFKEHQSTINNYIIYKTLCQCFAQF